MEFGNTLELFMGSGSFTIASHEIGLNTYGSDIIPLHADLEGNVEYTQSDILELDYFDWDPGYFFMIWASPPCPTYSIGAFGAGHRKNGLARSDIAKLHDSFVIRTLEIIEYLKPTYWIIENPNGLLKKQPFMEGIEMKEVTYCQYGDTRMKLTNLFGKFPERFIARRCNNGDFCHAKGQRGSKGKWTTQGLEKSKRQKVPFKLTWEIIMSGVREIAEVHNHEWAIKIMQL